MVSSRPWPSNRLFDDTATGERRAWFDCEAPGASGHQQRRASQEPRLAELAAAECCV